MLLRRRVKSSLDAWRRRLLRETEAAILYGFTHPEDAPRIPTVEVGQGRFERSFAAKWWSAVLDIDPASGDNEPP